MSDQRLAVVTGGNRGIGFEICRRLAGEGLRVVLAARDPEKARRSAEQLSRFGLDVVPETLDVGDAAAIARLAERLEREHGGADVLVNNAGVFLDRNHSGLDLPLAVARQTFETNLYGPWALCQTLVPAMKRRGYGRIVNVSSGLGAMSEMAGGYPAYRLSKLGLNGLTRVLADELRGTNVLVNTMCPGWVQTEMGGPNAPRPVAEAADTAIWLATLPDGGPTGKFFRDRRQIPW